MRYVKVGETIEYEHPRWGTPYKEARRVKHYQLVERNKYRPHTGKKQLKKAEFRAAIEMLLDEAA